MNRAILRSLVAIIFIISQDAKAIDIDVSTGGGELARQAKGIRLSLEVGPDFEAGTVGTECLIHYEDSLHIRVSKSVGDRVIHQSTLTARLREPEVEKLFQVLASQIPTSYQGGPVGPATVYRVQNYDEKIVLQNTSERGESIYRSKEGQWVREFILRSCNKG